MFFFKKSLHIWMDREHEFSLSLFTNAAPLIFNFCQNFHPAHLWKSLVASNTLRNQFPVKSYRMAVVTFTEHKASLRDRYLTCFSEQRKATGEAAFLIIPLLLWLKFPLLILWKHRLFFFLHSFDILEGFLLGKYACSVCPMFVWRFNYKGLRFVTVKTRPGITN